MADEEIPHTVDLMDSSDATHYDYEKPAVAIALKHERGSNSAPHIVASGKGSIAEQILQLAFAHGIKVRKDADLAELLGKLDIASPIPLEAYAAVAEILAYVYRANGMLSVTGDSKKNERNEPTG